MQALQFKILFKKNANLRNIFKLARKYTISVKNMINKNCSHYVFEKLNVRFTLRRVISKYDFMLVEQFVKTKLIFILFIPTKHLYAF